MGWLLTIHKSLKILYPKNEEIVSGWIFMKNKQFDGKRPLDVMKESLIGLGIVAKHLEHRMLE